jgi:6-phosphofructokinase
MMADQLKGSGLLVAQSGGPTAVINASLAGVVQEASAQRQVHTVWGAKFGAEGLLTNNLLNLSSQPAAIWDQIRYSPSAALGSCRHKLTGDDYNRALETLMAHDIRYVTYIGGNDSADTALGLQRAARGRGYDLAVISVPKTVDNDLPATDHCPGYGSAARFLAQSTQDVGLDTEAMRLSDPIKLIEVAGRDAGWLAAATTLGKDDERAAPHVVWPPELRIRVDQFIAAVERVYARLGYVVAVVAETVRDEDGQPIGRANSVLQADAFGHVTLAGTASFLAEQVGRALGVKARYEKPGTLQRMCLALASPVDLQEAYAVGVEAVRLALHGQSAKMVALRRESSDVYRCLLEPVDLSLVANQHRTLPDAFLAGDPFTIAPAFRDYALPLIGPPLPRYARLPLR